MRRASRYKSKKAQRHMQAKIYIKIKEGRGGLGGEGKKE